MVNKSEPLFPFEVFVSYMESIADLELTIAGGQAVSYWAERYMELDPELEKYGPYTSKDIDFVAPGINPRVVHKRLGGRLVLPKKMSAMHLTARIIVDMEGRDIPIDFLGSMRGVTNEDIEKLKIPVTFKTRTGKEFRVHVLHPVLCLESRVCNVAEVPDSYRTERGLNQLKAAIRVTKLYLSSLLDAIPGKDGVKKVLQYNERIFRFASKNDSALRLYAMTEIDPAEAILGDDERLPEKFRTTRYQQMRAKLKKR